MKTYQIFTQDGKFITEVKGELIRKDNILSSIVIQLSDDCRYETITLNKKTYDELMESRLILSGKIKVETVPDSCNKMNRYYERSFHFIETDELKSKLFEETKEWLRKYNEIVTQLTDNYKESEALNKEIRKNRNDFECIKGNLDHCCDKLNKIPKWVQKLFNA